MKRPALLLPLLLFAVTGAYAQPVDYTISARLDDAAGLLRGDETVRYRNLTSDTLGSIWFHLYANAFRSRSTTFAHELEAMGRFDFSLARERDRGWIAVDLVESGGRVALVSETETELGLFLRPPLAPGESVTISIAFRTKVPSRFAELARSGRSFVLTHWYLLAHETKQNNCVGHLVPLLHRRAVNFRAFLIAEVDSYPPPTS